MATRDHSTPQQLRLRLGVDEAVASFESAVNVQPEARGSRHGKPATYYLAQLAQQQWAAILGDDPPDSRPAAARWQELLEAAQLVLGQTPRVAAVPFLDQRPAKPAPSYKLTTEDIEALDRHVHHFCVKFGYLADEDDIRNQLVVQLLETDYLGRYDPKRNTIHGYLKWFVYHYFCRVYKVKKYAVNRADEFDAVAGLVRRGREEEFTAPAAAEAANDLDEATIEALERIADQLDTEFPFVSGARYRADTGEYLDVVWYGEDPQPGEFFIWRSAGNIFRLIALGFQQIEVARCARISKGFVSKSVRKMGRLDAVRRWAAQTGILDFDVGAAEDS